MIAIPESVDQESRRDTDFTPVYVVVKKLLCLTFMILPLALNFACHDNPVGADRGDLHLTAEDVGVTDVLLRVRVTQSDEQRTLTITRDGETILSDQVSALDTIVMSNSLLPKHSYTYTATLTVKNIFATTIAGLAVTTLDTSSHDFTWQIDTLGSGHNSSIRDVAIINDTLAYAVGEMYLRDSTGQFDPTPYNVAIWNGSDWVLKRIFYNDSNIIAPIRGVIAFGGSDVWLAAGSVFHWDGVSSEAQFSLSRLTLSDPNATVEKLWGTSSTNIYGVGNVGTIVYHSGGVWQQMGSGTDVDLLDVAGSSDGSVVWACGFYHSRPGTYLLSITHAEWRLTYDGTSYEFTTRKDSLSSAYSTVYAPTATRLFVGTGVGVYETTSKTHGEATLLALGTQNFPGFPNRLRGNGVNDLVLAGDYNSLAHFNGASWRYYSGSLQENRHLQSVDQKGNFIVAVGDIYDPINSRGIVVRGRR